jgi:3-oxoacyl-[acyl-carrier-protein] synthase-1
MKKIYLSVPALFCCAGQNRNELYESCLTGYQGGFVMREFSGRNFPVGLISRELPGAHLPESLANIGNTKIIRIINAALEQLRPVVEKAIAGYGPEKIGVCVGACDIGSESVLLNHRLITLSENALTKDHKPHFQSASFSAEFIAGKFGISGPAFTVATACASGANAIMRGAELIQTGHCSAVIVGGADSITDYVFAGFHSLDALSDSLSNPFSRNRKGINLGEGAAFFLMESDNNSGVELLGAGESVDAVHMTAPETDGTGPAKAMKAALLDAGLSSEQIGYVNLHGTGTELNDKAEAFAMKKVFGTAPPLPPPLQVQLNQSPAMLWAPRELWKRQFAGWYSMNKKVSPCIVGMASWTKNYRSHLASPVRKRRQFA